MDKNTLILAKQIYDIINNKKATSIEVLDVHQLTTLTDIFIIAVATNIRQTQAITDEIEEFLTDYQVPLLQKEGYTTAKWILLDYGNIIVHVLHQEDAAFYGLNRLWKDAKVITF
ncbi:ribosome silencing factor [Cellulosilyticum sp. I15G10I2]|uniref:ribosome silencing factor n=1 Tax=Cellulosilyticum sp. I15G10I2 TaxID=1892843 RepID=UPI00085CC6DE|nr:ribosome silencing factor [Cellulosilyticum sp. I15G10I2]